MTLPPYESKGTGQPDLGTTAIMGLLVFFIFMAVPFNKDDKDVKIVRILGVCGIILVAAFMMFGGKFLNSEQTSRLNYRAPCTIWLYKDESCDEHTCNYRSQEEKSSFTIDIFTKITGHIDDHDGVRRTSLPFCNTKSPHITFLKNSFSSWSQDLLSGSSFC